MSFLAAAVLYVLAVGQVKGFAFTLGMSTVLDLLVVFLVTHPLVALASNNRVFGSPAWSGLGAVARLGARRRRAAAARRREPEMADPPARRRRAGQASSPASTPAPARSTSSGSRKHLVHRLRAARAGLHRLDRASAASTWASTSRAARRSSSRPRRAGAGRRRGRSAASTSRPRRGAGGGADRRHGRGASLIRSEALDADPAGRAQAGPVRHVPTDRRGRHAVSRGDQRQRGQRHAGAARSPGRR